MVTFVIPWFAVKKIEQLQLSSGEEPFQKWISALDIKTRAKIHTYINRVAVGGSKKNIRAVGDGVFEIKIDFGPGYRVYFGEIEQVVILILLGGDKDSQNRDIKIAKEYWRIYVQK